MTSPSPYNEMCEMGAFDGKTCSPYTIVLEDPSEHDG